MSICSLALMGLLQVAWADEVPRRTDQEVTDQRLVDHGYLFEIGVPSDLVGEVLDAGRATLISRDAVAAIIGKGGATLVVTVDATSGGDLGAAARSLPDRVQLSNLEVGLIEARTVQGLPAYAVEYRGSFDGLAQQSVVLLTDHLGWRFQFHCSGVTQANRLKDDCRKMLDSVRMLDGDRIEPRYDLAPPPDQRGPGWRVRDGRSDSAAFGLSAEATRPGWRLAVGDELAEMDHDAEFGLIHAGPSIYVVATPQHVGTQDRQILLRSSRERTMQAWQALVPDGREQLVFLGQPMELECFQSGLTPPMEVCFGTVFVDDVMVDVTGWWVLERSQAARGVLVDGLDQLQRLDESAWRAVDDELAASPDPQNAVGRGYSLRRGVYRDFDHDFSWTLPDGYWRAWTSDDPDGPRLTLEAPTLGVYGRVFASRGQWTNPRELHAAAQEWVGGRPANRRPHGHQVPGATLLVSRLDDRGGGLSSRSLLATTVVDDVAVVIELWGYSSLVDAADALLVDALDGLAFPRAGLAATKLSPSGWVDERLGFAIDLGNHGGRLAEFTPPFIETVGAGAMATVEGGDTLLVMAICILGTADSESVLFDVIGALLQREGASSGSAAFDPADLRPTSLAGEPARGLVVMEGDLEMEMRLLQRDGTMVLAVASSKGDLSRRDELFDMVRLLD